MKKYNAEKLCHHFENKRYDSNWKKRTTFKLTAAAEACEIRYGISSVLRLTNTQLTLYFCTFYNPNFISNQCVYMKVVELLNKQNLVLTWKVQMTVFPSQHQYTGRIDSDQKSLKN